MGKFTSWIKKKFIFITESIVALMLATMFAVFLLQVFARYVLNNPFSWTPELCLALWVWIIFFGNGFIVKDRHQVVFDILYTISPPPLKKIFILISSAAIVLGMGMTFFPSYDYIDWLKIKKSATLKIPMRSLFSIYLVFVIAVILRYLWKLFYTIKYGLPKTEEHHYGDN